MNLLFLIFVSCALFLNCAFGDVLQAQKEEAHRSSAALIQECTRNFMKRLIPVLTPRERKVVDEIKFDDPALSPVDAWAIPSAYVRQTDKSRHVQLSAGFGALLTELSVAATLQFIDPSYESMKYVLYVGNSIHENKKNSRPSERIQVALQFYGVTSVQWDEWCSANNGYFSNTFVGWRQSMQDFVLAHEIAHHVLGHVAKEPPDDETSREQERAADDWAITKTFKMKELPVGGMLVAALLMSARANDIISEHLETHPAPVRRLDYILESIVGTIRKLPDDALPPGLNTAQFEQEMHRLYDQFHEMFESLIVEEPTDGSVNDERNNGSGW